MSLTLNEKFLAGFIGEGEIHSLAAQTRTAHETVRRGSGEPGGELPYAVVTACFMFFTVNIFNLPGS